MRRINSVHGLAILCTLIASASCERKSPLSGSATEQPQAMIEPSFAEQAEAVRNGQSDTIRLDETLVTDRDLAHIEGLDDKLRRINLSHTELSDAALARLAKFPQLEQLRVASPRFTNEGLAPLAETPKLKYLHLIGSPLTSSAVSHLSKLTGLSSLYLDGTELTLDDMRALSEALPTVHMHFDGGHHRDDTRADVHEK